jgi:methyl-accepting chemotaxis protein
VRPPETRRSEAADSQAAYHAYLHGRWAVRGRNLGLVSCVSSLVWLGMDLLHARTAGLALPLSTLAALRLPWALLPLAGLLLLRLVPAWRHLPVALLAVTWGYCVGNDLGFFLLGTAGAPYHAMQVMASVLGALTLLPLRRGDRVGFLVGAAVAHAAMELAFPLGRPLGGQLWSAAVFLVTGALVNFNVAAVQHTHFVGFQLRRRSEQAVAELEASRASIGEAVVTLAGSVAQLAEGARSLSAGSAQSRARSQEMAQATEGVARAARALEERSRGGATTAEQTQVRALAVEELLGAVEQGVQSITGAVEASEARLTRLEGQARRIGSFVEMVQGIAARTQMLALNAGIEAQRAGAHGKGFGVIAREVRQLAQQSGAGSQEVAQVVEALRQEVASTREGMEEVRARTARFVTVYAQARETLAQVQDSILLTGAVMQDNVAEAGRQAAATEGISESTARLSALTEEQAALAGRVDATGQELAQLATHLRTLLPRAPGGRAAELAA